MVGTAQARLCPPYAPQLRRRDFPRALEFLARLVEHEQRALGDAEIGAVELQLVALDPRTDEGERHQILEAAEHRGLLDAGDEILHGLVRALFDDLARL